jgi:hypothetical protein
MPHRTPQRLTRQVGCLQRQFAQAPGLPFAGALDPTQVQQALDQEHLSFRHRLFTPLVTLWVFLSQTLDADTSCRQAVARFLGYRLAQGLPACSPRTGAYCKARARLPEGVLARLTRRTGWQPLEEAPGRWLWHGRDVKVVDGTTLSMPDTAANQAAFPQARTQKPGVGFPIVRLVVLFSLAVATVLDAALGRYQGKETGETALLRQLHDNLHDGDILLGDRYFGSWFEVALVQQRGADAVVRQHQRRHVNFRAGRRLGRRDHVVFWPKPARPEWLDEATYAQLPATLEVREVEVRVRQPGFRTDVLVVATTLLDAVAVSAAELAGLYRARWQAELDLRSLKVTLQMDVLRCLSPAMVRKEIWAHLLVYNLIRTVMAQAAQTHGLLPVEISFQGARQTLQAFAAYLLVASAAALEPLCQGLLTAVATHRVGNRPDRYEPRAKKRRPKSYPLLNEPRHKAKARLATTG